MTELLNLGQMNLYLGVKFAANDYTEWDYQKKSCPKCVDGVIGEEEGGTITMAD